MPGYPRLVLPFTFAPKPFTLPDRKSQQVLHPEHKVNTFPI